MIQKHLPQFLIKDGVGPEPCSINEDFECSVLMLDIGPLQTAAGSGEATIFCEVFRKSFSGITLDWFTGEVQIPQSLTASVFAGYLSGAAFQLKFQLGPCGELRVSSIAIHESKQAPRISSRPTFC